MPAAHKRNLSHRMQNYSLVLVLCFSADFRPNWHATQLIFISQANSRIKIQFFCIHSLIVFDCVVLPRNSLTLLCQAVFELAIISSTT